MAAPGIPYNFQVQQGNGQVLLTWDLVSGATSYPVSRSIDGVTYSLLATATTNQYLDTTGTVGTNYFYYVQSTGTGGTSSACPPQSITPTLSGDMTLGQIRLMAQQRADRVNSPFVTMPEWNTYINQSYFELYDLLITCYEDYYVKAPLIFSTNGVDQQYTLPNDFYKLMGVDLGLSNNQNAWVTLKKFEFIQRNRYIFPQITSTYLGVYNLRYRLVGNTLMFIPAPSAGQYLRIWYIPKLVQLLMDTDIVIGISGWTEYIVVDAAIKALEKEESDTQTLMMQKQALIKRIEETAMNRDAGQGDTISDTRTRAESWGGMGFDGSWGGQ